MTVLPTNEDFAVEVKSDRLRILYRSTITLCVVILMLLITFGVAQSGIKGGNLNVALGLFTIICGCLLTHALLQRNRLTPASWSYGLGAALGCGVLLYLGDNLAHQILPFVFPVIVFIIGLLLSPANTFAMGIISTVVVLVAPSLGREFMLTAPVHQLFAIFLMLLSALLAAQVTGELYQITEWALSNYQRERRTNEELFEKRQALQMSLKRSEALADKLRDTNRDLEAAKALADEAKNFRGKFLANMSHELRTPLNAIIGFSETMLQFPIMYDNEELPTAYEKDLGQIYNSGRQLLHVINDILDLAKVDAGKLEIHVQKVDIKPVISAVVSTAKGLLGAKPIKLEQEIPDPLPFAWADETRLRQVLLNLYSNACKYTDAGFIRLCIRETNGDIEFSVQDTGVGIDAEYQPKLFQEFQQAKAGGRDARSGSGLGLAISQHLLELMGGRIWMTSKVGEGSTFYFTVKLYTGQDNKPVTSDKRPDILTIPASEAASQPVSESGG
jgi:signal transduction histidine kinase